MIIKMKKQDFDLLTPIDISQRCFEPLIKVYKDILKEQHSVDPTQLRKKFYSQLNKDQQALFMFFTYYNHAKKSMADFYWWSAYFIAQPQTWTAIKDSLRYFNDETMIQLLEKMELALKQHNHPATIENFNVNREELDHNIELHSSIKLLNEIFVNISGSTLEKINRYVEQNFQRFIEIEV